MPSRSLTVHGNGLFFDERPIELAGFTLTARSAIAVGKPKPEQWIAAVTFCRGVEEGSPYWIGDLMAYGESRADWREKFEQMVAVTGLARQTIHNRTYISRHIDEHERQLAPSLAHAAEVAPLPRPEQTKYLEKARDEELTVRELRATIRSDQRRKVIEGQADEVHTVDVIVRISVEAAGRVQAEDEAWKIIAGGLKRAEVRAHVIAARGQNK